MFERFTEKAVKVIMLAKEEARRLGHNCVGTEQILLALIGEGTSVATKILQSMGVNLKDARIEVEKIIGHGSSFVGEEIPFTPGAKRFLELSLEEARKLGHNYIGTEHLLLGLICERKGVAARVLENLGVDFYKVRTQVIRMLGETAEISAASSSGRTKISTLDRTFAKLRELQGIYDSQIGQRRIDRWVREMNLQAPYPSLKRAKAVLEKHLPALYFRRYSQHVPYESGESWVRLLLCTDELIYFPVAFGQPPLTIAVYITGQDWEEGYERICSPVFSSVRRELGIDKHFMIVMSEKETDGPTLMRVIESLVKDSGECAYINLGESNILRSAV